MRSKPNRRSVLRALLALPLVRVAPVAPAVFVTAGVDVGADRLAVQFNVWCASRSFVLVDQLGGVTPVSRTSGRPGTGLSAESL